MFLALSEYAFARIRAKLIPMKKKVLLDVFLYASLGVLALRITGLGNDLMNTILEALLFMLGAGHLIFGDSKSLLSDKKRLLLFGVPVFLLCFTLSISRFWLGFGSSILSGFLSLLGMLGAVLLGLSLKIQGKKLSLILFFVLGALSFSVLVSYIATMAGYGPFYAARFASMEYFYDGVAYPVAKEALFLRGFKLQPMSLDYAGAYAFPLACSLIGILFLDWKKDRVLGIFLASAGGLGFLYLASIPAKIPLILLLFVYLIAALFRFAKFKKEAALWEKIAFGAIIGVGLALVFFMMVVAIRGTNIYAGNRILRKIFDNGRLTHPISEIVNATTHEGSKFSFLGFLLGLKPLRNEFNPSLSYFGGSMAEWTSANLRTFEFGAYMEGGLLAFLSMIFLFVYGMMIFRKEYRDENGNFSLNAILLALPLFGYVLYLSFCYDAFPEIRNGLSYYSAFSGNGLFLMALFLTGYCYRLPKKEVES